MLVSRLLGMLIRDLGEDYVMWGTDSLLRGNFQWQIDAFRRFQIPDELITGRPALAVDRRVQRLARLAAVVGAVAQRL